MTDFLVTIQSDARPVALNDVRRIDEENRPLFGQVRTDDFQTVVFLKDNSAAQCIDASDPICQGVGVPTRAEAFAIFALFKQTCSWRKDAAVLHSVLQEASKRPRQLVLA